jgi:WD40 repeat protein
VGHHDRVDGVAFAPDGDRALSGSNDGTVRVWEVATGRELHCLASHREEVWKAAYSPTQPLALSCGNDHTMRLWRLPP